MKHLLAMFAIISAISLGSAYADEGPTPDSLIWCGLDYSVVKMIGTTDFHEPDKIFPGMLDEWNGLFLKEMLPQLEKMASSVYFDVKAVGKPNSKATASQIINEDGTKDEMVKPSHITEKNIADAVKGYEIKYKQGLGLVFIVDRFVGVQKTECLYVVFFDVASRKVLFSERQCTTAEGFGFRNYWFRPVKNAMKKLPAQYKDAKSKR